MTIILVDPELLAETPLAFQQYVAEFFVERQVLGRRVLLTSAVLSYYPPTQKGTAPSHSVDLMRFKSGLSEGEDLHSWMSKRGHEGKFFWKFYDHEPRGGYNDD